MGCNRTWKKQFIFGVAFQIILGKNVLLKIIEQKILFLDWI